MLLLENWWFFYGEIQTRGEQFGTQLNGKKNQDASLGSISAQKQNCKESKEE